MSLHESKKQQLLNWLQAKGVRDDCPACGATGRHPGDIVAPPTTPDGGGTVVGGPNFPLVQVICQNCGYVMHFATTSIQMPT